MANPAICCTHEQLRIDSPEPPARPLAAIDGIFAAAVLPEDHPHALRFPERKPETDSAIVQSPSITSKIKLQFQRKSVKNLKKKKEYDEDARQMTLQEVLYDLEVNSELDDAEKEKPSQHRFGSVLELAATTRSVSPAISPDVRKSVLNTLGYLQPLLQRTSDQRASFGLLNPTISNVHPAARTTAAGVSRSNDVSAPVLSRSFSSPALVSADLGCIQPIRSRSEHDLAATIAADKNQSSLPPKCLHTKEALRVTHNAGAAPSDLANAPKSSFHIQETTRTDDSENLVPFPAYEEPERSISNDEAPHLYKMGISQQLRCMSQLSDTAGNELWPRTVESSHASCPDLRLSSGRGRHYRQKSSSGIDSATVPPWWGRVCPPVHDAASSIYSRPASPVSKASEHEGGKPHGSREERLSNLNAIFADWPLKPLKPPESLAAAPTTSEATHGTVPTGHLGKKSLSAIPGDGSPDSASSSFTATTDDVGGASVRFLSLPRKPTPIPSKSSSSILTKGSKTSRFLERFSPPTKLVRKRHSVFKFLRPGSRKQQARSISSPILNAASTTITKDLDGQVEDPALLTVSYELSEHPTHVTRSVSAGQLGVPSTETEGFLAPNVALERRPTLADYERNLSVLGDDRRRPSTVNIHRAKEIQEDDRRESLSVKRKLSRARALPDDASPLMAQALEKHQQEKALFRSASKQRDSLKDVRPAASFGSAAFIGPGTSVSTRITTTDYSDLLDPLEKGELIGSRQDPDAGQFLTPPVKVPGSSQRSSATMSTRAPSTKTSFATPTVRTISKRPTRIGTSLESWSRYPSHTRADRCGPAGEQDAVISRDFAGVINPDEIHVDEHHETSSPGKRELGMLPSHRSKSASPSTRSMTFSSIVRYYSNLFHTRGWHGQNRRTSVTLGGKLEYPELEMLPPQMSTETTSSHKHSDYLKRFEEHLKEDADKLKHYLQEEETKAEAFVKKEEDKLEDFMKDEEQKLETFVKKEEDKLKDFVAEEEHKIMHRHSQHHRSPSRHSSHSSHRKESPFRAGNIFEAPSLQTSEHPIRSETMVGPNDGVNEQTVTRKMPDGQPTLDGSSEIKNKVPSKAEVWSELYKECLLRPVSRGATESDSTNLSTQSRIMPIPSLKPVKPRTPEKPKSLDPKASIRRFPSVTVIDDQKGHSRSISLVSVQTRKSTSFERSSTHDMVELIQARERQERDKLLSAFKLAH